MVGERISNGLHKMEAANRQDVVNALGSFSSNFVEFIRNFFVSK